MAILVTMQVGPVDWTKFKAALDGYKGIDAPGLHSSRTYRLQSDPSQVLVVEEWDSHDAMHAFQDKVGEDFNRQAGTEGLEWTTQLWEIANER